MIFGKKDASKRNRRSTFDGNYFEIAKTVVE